MEHQKKLVNTVVYVKKTDIPTWTTKRMQFVKANAKASTSGGFVDYTFSCGAVEYHFPDWLPFDVDDLIEKLGTNDDKWHDAVIDIVGNVTSLVAVVESERVR